ncbi:MAG: AAA family ATPase [Candidatus Omnitrophica bacterium]|nr:AAA family ATPase [Candidatus Omnitrophota bacterium]
MYEGYWGLREKPFENTPDPRFYFASSQHQEACARMLYCIRERKGAAMLTGVFGCGKTVVSQVILQELNQERYRTAVITNPRLSDLDLLRKIAHHLGIQNPPKDKADVLILLEQLTADNAKEGRDTVIVVDEAHAIHDPGVFEELRLLLNFQWHHQFLVTLLLLGQPELAAIIESNKPLEQRISLKARLDPLSAEETRDYIRYRLQVAGHVNPSAVFTPEAVRMVYESTGGIPRRINRLCDIALLAAMGLKLTAVEAFIISDEVKGLAV